MTKKRKIVLMTSVLMAITLLAGCKSNHVHDWGEVTYTWATDYSTCTALRVCKGDENHREEETVESVYKVTTPATCEVDGKGEYTATFTNTTFEAQTREIILSATDHNWGTPIYTWSNDYSSCTAERVCLNDPAHIETETKNSTYAVITQATCDDEGLGRYTVTFENIAFTTQTHDVTLDATGHSFGTPTYTWSDDYSSCTAERVCLNNSTHKETETVESTYTEITPATCQTDGIGRYTTDTFTNNAFAVQSKDVAIPAGHNYGTPTYIWSDDYSSCTATRVCENDSTHIESETVDSAYTVIIPATCDVDGSAVYDAAFENEAFEAQSHEITLSATGHNYGTPTYTWSDDNKTCTAERVCLNDPTHKETETVESTYTEITPATCEEGLGRYTTNAFENIAFSVQTKDVTIPANHNWGTPTYTWNEDYSSCTVHAVCQNDSSHVFDKTVTTTISGQVDGDVVKYGYVADFKTEGIENAINSILILTPISNGTAYSVKAASTSIAGSIEIPAEYDGKPVTHIADRGFRFCENITSVFIPESVISFGEYSFGNCKKLENINLPNGLTVLPDDCFELCYSLKSITIPASVTTISSCCFQDCESLTNVTFAEGSQLKSIEICAFEETGLVSITLPATLQSIGKYSFEFCYKLETIRFLGTIEQWENIKKGYEWCTESPCTTINCSDGDTPLTYDVSPD